MNISKGSLEEAKKQDLILDYKILLGTAATPQDACGRSHGLRKSRTEDNHH
jgi:hypothetical protein